MSGYSPQSDDFLNKDPECIEEYSEWQRFARFLVDDKKTDKINIQTGFSISKDTNKKQLTFDL